MQKTHTSTILIDSKSLKIKDVTDVAKNNFRIALSQDSTENIKAGRKLVENIIESNKIVYSINTGFGALCRKIISKENIKQMQKNFLMSHAVGVDDPFSEEVTRGIMLLRINTLASGNCGVRLELVQTLVDMLNLGVHPYIPQKGSVGASGDLAPLAHLSAILLGIG